MFNQILLRMKKLLLPLFLFAVMVAKGQYIPNPDFENWTSGEPDGWQTPNSFTTTYGVITVTQETANPYNGTSDIKLETKNIFGYAVPGLVANGQLSINLSNTPPVTILGGTPCNQRPNDFKGYFRYTPGGSDYCQITALLLKKNTQTNQFDTVAVAQFMNTATVSTWTLFDAPFSYKNGDTPDTLQISAISSNPNASVLGSTLYLDHLYLEGGSLGNMTLRLNDKIQIFPNPINDIINIYFGHPLTVKANISIFNTLGQKVKESIIPTGTQLSSLNVYNLKQGLYFVQITYGKEQFIEKVHIK